MKELHNQNVQDNTMVIFTSDNGPDGSGFKESVKFSKSPAKLILTPKLRLIVHVIRLDLFESEFQLYFTLKALQRTGPLEDCYTSREESLR